MRRPILIYTYLRSRTPCVDRFIMHQTEFVQFIMKMKFLVRSHLFRFERRLKTCSLSVYTQKYILCCQIEWNMIVVTAYIPILSQIHGIPFGSKSKEKLLPRSYSIRFERKLVSFTECVSE